MDVYYRYRWKIKGSESIGVREKRVKEIPQSKNNTLSRPLVSLSLVVVVA